MILKISDTLFDGYLNARYCKVRNFEFDLDGWSTFVHLCNKKKKDAASLNIVH